MSTIETPAWAAPQAIPERRRSRSAIVAVVLAVLLVLTLAAAAVALVKDHAKYDALSARYATQASQVKDLNGTVADLKGTVSDQKSTIASQRSEIQLGHAAARAGSLMARATWRLNDGYNQGVFTQYVAISDALRLVKQAQAIAEANGYANIASLLRAGAGGYGTTL